MFKRLGLVLATWALIALAQPGVVGPDGFGHLAFFALGPWAFAASRSGPKAFLVEWVGHALGLASVYAWMLEFLPAILPPMSIVPALYPALAGVLLRRAQGRVPLALLAPAAWILAEVVRWTLPVPFSFGWFRLGMLMHDTTWLVGSAAWFGTWGLTYGMAALGGMAADLAPRFLGEQSTADGAARPVHLGAALFLGVGPLAALVGLDVAADRAVDAQSFGPGPDVLVVQPAVEQSIKSARRDPFTDVFVPQVTATIQAIYETRPTDPETGKLLTGNAGLPDLVCWGETFLPGKLADEETLRAFDQGARPTSYARSRELTREEIVQDDLWARELARTLFGKCTLASTWPKLWRATFTHPKLAPEWADRVVRGETLLPLKTHFLTGVEAWTVREEAGAKVLKSLNAVALFDPDGSVSPLASKVHLVPGGESVEPLKRVPFVVDAIRSIASNVPDFAGEPEPRVLTLRTSSGESYRTCVLVCFDNAFDDVFAGPVRREPVDLFVLVSNEAWYGASPEMDHMLCFTRIAAAETQRSIVRATNSGISAIVGPRGEPLELLEVDGERKMVKGALRGVVPVPERPSQTFYCRTEQRQPALWAAVGVLGLCVGALFGRRRPRVSATA